MASHRPPVSDPGDRSQKLEVGSGYETELAQLVVRAAEDPRAVPVVLGEAQEHRIFLDTGVPRVVGVETLGADEEVEGGLVGHVGEVLLVDGDRGAEFCGYWDAILGFAGLELALLLRLLF